MTITQLTYFVAAAEQLHLTRVAEQFHVSQPAVSAAIRDLEKEFRIKLFDRRHKDIHLTPEGDRAYRGAKELLAHYDQFCSSLSAAARASQSCTFAIAPNVSVLHLPDLYRFVSDHAPHFTLVANEDHISNMNHMLKNGLLDVACYACNPPYLDPELHHIRVSDMVLKLCVHHSLFHSDSASVPVTALEHLPFALYRRSSLLNIYVQDLFAQAGIVPKVIYEANQLSTLRRMVQMGIAGSLLPPSVFQRDADIGLYDIGTSTSVPIHLVYKNRTQDIETFLSLARDYFKNSRP